MTDDTDLFWRPMSTCPLGLNVLLLSENGVAVSARYYGDSPLWVGWHPVPRVPHEIEKLINERQGL